MITFILFAILSYFTPDMSIDFARKLENEGDYYRAILEYKRAYYSLPDTGAYKYTKDEIAYSIAKMYEKLGDYSSAEQYIDRVNDKETKRYRFEKGLLYFIRKDYRNARKFWSYSDTLRAWTYLREKDFKRAKKVFGEVSYPYRYPALASVLSAIVPGLGKVYTGRAYDGIYSLILNAGSFYLAYDAYKHKRKPEVYLYGGIFAFFYTGNIYGSWISARKFNEYHIKAAITEKEISLGLWKYLP